MLPDTEPYRPHPSERWTKNVRTEPARILARTRFLYSAFDPRALVPPGETRHAFSRGARLASADLHHPVDKSVADHLYTAIAAFGDDCDLVIEVRRATPEESEQIAAALADREDTD